MRQAGATILWEFCGNVESEVLVERVYLVMHTVRLREILKPKS